MSLQSLWDLLVKNQVSTLSPVHAIPCLVSICVEFCFAYCLEIVINVSVLQLFIDRVV